MTGRHEFTEGRSKCPFQRSCPGALDSHETEAKQMSENEDTWFISAKADLESRKWHLNIFSDSCSKVPMAKIEILKYKQTYVKLLSPVCSPKCLA